MPETTIIIQGAKAGKSAKAQWTFETDQGKFKVWPESYDKPHPVFKLFRDGIGQTFKINYSEKPWKTPEGNTVQIRTVEEAWPPEGGETSGAASASAGEQTTAQPANGSPGAIQNDDPRIVINYQGEFRSPMMSWASEVVAGAMRSGQFIPEQIDQLTVQAIQAWLRVPEIISSLRVYTTDTDEYSEIHGKPIDEPPRFMDPPAGTDPGYPEQR